MAREAQKSRKHPATEGVYLSLADMVALRHRAPALTFLPRQKARSLLAGRHSSRLRGRGLNFEEIRNYEPGDDVRSIDWNVTARTGKPHVRVYTEERDRPVLIVVDQRIAMFFGTRLMMKSYAAAELAALAAWRVLDVGDRVGGLVFDDHEIVEVRPHRNETRVMRFLQVLETKNRALRADLAVESDGGKLDEALRHAEQLATHDHLVIVISDFDGAGDRTRRHISALARHNDVVCALVHDPMAMLVPEQGRFTMTDGEMQIEIDLGDRRVNRRLAAFSGERIQRLLDWQQSFGLPILPFSAGEPVLPQAVRMFGLAGG